MRERGPRNNVRYALLSGALFYVGFLTAQGSPNLLGMEIFPLPVAYYVVRGRPDRAGGLLACAALAGGLGGKSLLTALFFALGAATGLLLGRGVALRQRYGQIVARVTVCAGALLTVYMGLTWETWQEGWRTLFEFSLASVSEPAEPPPNADVSTQIAVEERRDQTVRAIAWLRDNGPMLSAGMTLGTALMGVCAGLSLLTWWVRRQDAGAGPSTTFREMRPPDWLVWVVIGVAALWFAQRYRPTAALEFISWNSAIALAVVYWLNGLSIVIYTVHALRNTLFVYFAAALVVVYGQVLCFVGLFDTWADFRKRLDKWIAARRDTNDSGGHVP